MIIRLINTEIQIYIDFKFEFFINHNLLSDNSIVHYNHIFLNYFLTIQNFSDLFCNNSFFNIRIL